MRKRFLAISLTISAGIGSALAAGAEAGGSEAPAMPPATVVEATHPLDASGDAALLERIAAVARAMKTMQGTFVKHTFNPGMQDDPVVTKGKFAIAVPDKYNLVETKPDEPEYRKRTCSDGASIAEIEQISSELEPDTHVRAVGDADVELRRVLACVRGDFTQLKADFSVMAAVAPKPADGSTVTLTPTNADVAHDLTKVEIRLDAACHASAIELVQPSGTRILVRIDGAEYDRPIAADTFSMPGNNLPSGK